MAQNKRTDPFGAYNFRVEIGGIIRVGFSEVSGLQVETETEEVREGGVNNYVHKLPKRTKQSNITLKNGLTDSDSIWKWYKDVIAGIIERKTGCIILIDNQGNRVMQWDFIEAYPVKWTGPELRAGSNNIAFESLEIVHNGLSMQKLM